MIEAVGSALKHTPAEIEAADDKISAYTARFSDAHRYLAYHAAFPLAFAPDMVYRLWANFQRDSDGNLLNVPWVAVADLLLSNLCDEVGHELYRMDVVVRDLLLEELVAHPRFGPSRLLALAGFLESYVEQELDSPAHSAKVLAEAQRWTARVYTAPAQVVQEISQELQKLNWGDDQEALKIGRLSQLLLSFGRPLRQAGYGDLVNRSQVARHLAVGDSEKAATIGRQLGVAAAGSATAAALNLPAEFLARLQEQAPADTTASAAQQSVPAAPAATPFIISGPVPDDSPVYVVRQVEQAIFGHLSSRNHVVLFGPAASGKSSLLLRLKGLAERNLGYASVYLPLSLFLAIKDPSAWLGALCESLKEGVKAYGEIDPALPPAMAFAEFTSFLNALARMVGRQIFILFDDLWALPDGWVSSFFDELSRLGPQRAATKGGGTGGNILYLLAGSGMEPVFSAATPDEIVYLPDFSRDEMAQLFNLLPLDWFTSAAESSRLIDAAYDWTAGQPYLSQLLAQLIVATPRPEPERKLPDAKTLVDELAERLTASPLAAGMAQDVQRWADGAKMVRNLLLNPRPPFFSRRDPIIARLALMGVVKEGEGHLTRIRNGVFVTALRRALMSEREQTTIAAVDEEQAAYQEAVRRIEAAESNGATTLDLSTLALTELPPEIGRLDQLEVLICLGQEAGGSSKMMTLPPAFGRLKNLNILNLAGNRLGHDVLGLPAVIGDLSALHKLNLAHNHLSELPPEIGRLSDLESLDLSNNILEELPVELFDLYQLRSLELSGNGLGELPEEIGRLQQLEVLGLSSNQLNSLPNSLFELRNLRRLDLSNNYLSDLPAAFAQLRNLRQLDLRPGRELGIPEEILISNLENPAAILAYWQAQQANKSTSQPADTTYTTTIPHHFPLDRTADPPPLLYYRPGGVRTLKVRVTSEGAMPPLRVRPQNRPGREQGIVRGAADASDAFQLLWGGGHEEGPPVHAGELMGVITQAEASEPGHESYLYFHLRHSAPAFSPVARLTMEAVNESGEVIAALPMVLAQPSLPPPDLIYVAPAGSKRWQTTTGRTLPQYDPVWWPESEIAYQTVEEPISLTIDRSEEQLYVSWGGATTPSVIIHDNTRPTRFDQADSMAFELFHFDQWHVALRAWFFWNDLTIGRRYIVGQHEVPDVERFDFLIRKHDGLVTLACTDQNWREVWGFATQRPLRAELGLTRNQVFSAAGQALQRFLNEAIARPGQVGDNPLAYIRQLAGVVGRHEHVS